MCENCKNLFVAVEKDGTLVKRKCLASSESLTWADVKAISTCSHFEKKEEVKK